MVYVKFLSKGFSKILNFNKTNQLDSSLLKTDLLPYVLE